MRAQPVGELKSGAAGGWKGGAADHRAEQPAFPDRLSLSLGVNFNIVFATDSQARLPLRNRLP